MINNNGITKYSCINFKEDENFNKGYYAAQKGIEKDQCPYKKKSQKESWIGGWETCCIDGEFNVLKG